MKSINSSDLDCKRICYECIGEKFLSLEIQKNGRVRKCSYCGVSNKTIVASDLADKIQQVFEQLYERTSEYPDSFQEAMMKDNESSYEWEREGEGTVDAIENLVIIERPIAEDLQQILADRFYDRSAEEIGEETEFDDSIQYDYMGVSAKAWEEEWNVFEKSLKTETRYFNQSGEAYLHRVFDGIDQLNTANGEPIIIIAGKSHKLNVVYRSRCFQSNESLRQALSDVTKHLGPPPHKMARAGRMNAVGVSVFYGSTKEATALAEVRPPVGSKVVVAKFNIIRDLRLLNLTALSDLKSEGSLFDDQFVQQLSRTQFIRQLCNRMTIPVMPDDENTEYLITQAIADYLAKNEKLNLDGIIFPSIQVAGKDSNIILFNKASKVLERQVPAGTEVEVKLEDYDEDGPYSYYAVYEETPPTTQLGRHDKPTPHNIMLQRESSDKRQSSLSIDDENIKIHDIKAVTYDTEENTLSIFRHEKVKFDDTDNKDRIPW